MILRGNPRLDQFRRARTKLGRTKLGSVKRRLLGTPPPVVTQTRISEYEAWVAPGALAPRPGRPGDPLISVLMAVHNPPPAFLSAALASVTGQSAPNWELVLSDDGSSDPQVAAILAEVAASDPRIKLVRAEVAGGIVAALNNAFALATGQYAGVLDHDDLLHPRAIEIMTEAIARWPAADLIYSDEDKIDEEGNHFDPCIKPGYSPELLLSNMYLNHFTVMRSSLISDVGVFRSGTSGAQDHDLAFRMIRAGAQVEHVDGVLYHWRAWSQSTASGIQAKPWAQVAAAEVQSAHLQALGLVPRVTPSEIPGLNEPRWEIVGSPKLSIVIPTASRGIDQPGAPATLVEQCLRSLHRSGGWPNTELIIVHTGPVPERQQRLFAEFGALVVPYPPAQPFNFAIAVNLGVAHATGDYVLLLNDDTEVRRPDPLPAMLEMAQLPGVGAVGARLSFPDGSNQHSGMLMIDGLPTHPLHRAEPGYAGYFGSIVTPRNYLAVTGAALLTPRALYEDLGGMDELWGRDFQDVDYCLRVIESGLRICYTPYAHFLHHEAVSLQRQAADPLDVARFRAKWARRFPADPNYSPLLSQTLSELYQVL